MQKEGSKPREDDGILKGRTQTPKAEITALHLTKLDDTTGPGKEPLQRWGPLTEASAFLCALLSLE